MRNVAIVATGTAGAQAISMIFSPVITRLYGPEAYGLLGTFTAIITILTPIAALTYPIAIVLPKEDAEAWGIARLSAIIAVVMAVISASVFLLAGDLIAKLLKLEAISGFFWLIPLVMLFAALSQIISQWLIRKKLFNISARVAIAQALIISSAKAGIGIFSPTGAVLIVLTFFGQVLQAFLFWLGVRDQPIQKEISINELGVSIKKLARRHLDFPVYRAPQVAINSISQSLPILLLNSFFGPAAAGFYSLGKAVISLPSSLIGTAVGDVFYSRIAEADHNNENLFRLIIMATVALAALGFLPFAIVVVFGPWLFSFVFGADWITAGEYARWLSLWMFFAFLNRPSISAIAVLSMQRFFLFYELISVISRVAALFLGFYIFKSDVYAIAIFSSTGVALNTMLILFTLFACYPTNHKTA